MNKTGRKIIIVLCLLAAIAVVVFAKHASRNSDYEIAPEQAEERGLAEIEVPVAVEAKSQEVEQVVPGVVRVMEDSTMAVAYTDLVPLLVEAMKEQQVHIESLQATLNIQAEEISRIKQRRWFRKNPVE